jgi:hypothetical protein
MITTRCGVAGVQGFRGARVRPGAVQRLVAVVMQELLRHSCIITAGGGVAGEGAGVGG